MWFQAEGAPDPADRGLAQPRPARQHAAGPMGCALGCLLQRQANHLLNLVIADLARGSRTRLVAESRHALGDEAIPPEANREASGMQLPSDCGIVQPRRAFQDDLGPKYQRTRHARLPRKLFQLCPLD
jgi:hypothetical protein